jgi:hypothetical protein
MASSPRVRRFHIFLGLSLIAGYIYVVLHRKELLPGLSSATAGGVVLHGAARGFLVIYGLPLAAIFCFLWPERLMWRLSPRIPPFYDYLLTENFWYFVGYFLAVIGIGVLMPFT